MKSSMKTLNISVVIYAISFLAAVVTFIFFL